jgi:hypothetical protein
MAYRDTYKLMVDEQLIEKLTVACADVARDVYAEATNVPNYEIRRALIAYAGPGTSNFRNFAKELALVLLVVNATLTLASTDAVLKTAVAALWTTYARILERKGVISEPVVAP